MTDIPHFKYYLQLKTRKYMRKGGTINSEKPSKDHLLKVFSVSIAFLFWRLQKIEGGPRSYTALLLPCCIGQKRAQVSSKWGPNNFMNINMEMEKQMFSKQMFAGSVRQWDTKRILINDLCSSFLILTRLSIPWGRGQVSLIPNTMFRTAQILSIYFYINEKNEQNI